MLTWSDIRAIDSIADPLGVVSVYVDRPDNAGGRLVRAVALAGELRRLEQDVARDGRAELSNAKSQPHRPGRTHPGCGIRSLIRLRSLILFGNDGPGGPLVGVDAGIAGGIAGGAVLQQCILDNRGNPPSVPVHKIADDEDGRPVRPVFLRDF